MNTSRLLHREYNINLRKLLKEKEIEMNLTARMNFEKRLNMQKKRIFNRIFQKVEA